MPFESQEATTWKEQFDKNGYIVVDDLFTREETGRIKEEIRIIDDAEKRTQAGGNGVYMCLAIHSELMRQVAADHRLVQVLKQVIGDDIMFMNDKLVAKSEQVEFATPWHQDWAYWHGSHKTIVWIALDDATVENGCLRFIPGSHLGDVAHASTDPGRTGFVMRLRPEDIDENKAVSVPAKAGTAIIFSDLTIHSSHPNRSGKDRWAISSIYKNTTAEDPEYAWAVYPMVVSGSK